MLGSVHWSHSGMSEVRFREKLRYTSGYNRQPGSAYYRKSTSAYFRCPVQPDRLTDRDLPHPYARL